MASIPLSRLLSLSTLALSGGCVFASDPVVSHGPFEGAPPNIIYILADDLGYGEIGAYGQEIIRTPALDNLAREGILFTSHYAGSPICAPARSTLMTGLHTGHTPVRNNFGVDPETGEDIRVPLLAGDRTVAEALQAAGYRTGLIGKWGLGEEGTEGVPWKKGFETFFGFLNQKRAHNHYPKWVWEEDRKFVLKGNHDDGRETYVHDLFTERAAAFIEAAKEDPRPFFLYLAYTVPHSDLAVPDDQPRAGDDPNSIFAAMVERMDRDIGRLVQLVDARGLGPSTVIFFTSDNGAHSQQGKDNDHFNASGPFRGIKRDVYEGGIRVPFLARWSGRIVPGSRSDHPSAFWDFFPTACELAGVVPPENLDGISFLPALLGFPNRQHDFMYWEFEFKGDGRRAIRSGNWKLVLQGRGGPRLFHLPTDPGESHDLSSLYPEIAAHLREAMDRARTPSRYFHLSQD